MTTRRDFIKMTAAAGIAANIPSLAFPQPNHHSFTVSQESPKIWANLLHLSTNMWEDHAHIKKLVFWPDIIEEEIHRDDYECKTCRDAVAWGLRAYRPYLVHDESVWNKILKQMSTAGMNMVVIDLGDAIQYESHPEIAVKNAWSTQKLKKELAKIRKLGLEPIPKMNFATTHDAWLGEYSRMVSTKKYYEICQNLISEVIDLFDTPRFFHLGMDEETAGHQESFDYAVMRQNDLWWHDLYFFIDQTEKKGVRPWVWADYGWRYPDLFFKKMPKSVLLSNWYYESNYNLAEIKGSPKIRVEYYMKLEAAGYDQIPTGGNWLMDDCMEATVNFCKSNIDPSRLLGFMTTTWIPTLPLCLEDHLKAVDQVEHAKKRFYK